MDNTESTIIDIAIGAKYNMKLGDGTLLQGGRYRIIKSIGQGGFGITYLAEQTMAKRKVCIKEFFPEDYYKRDELTNCISILSHSHFEAMSRFKAKFIKEAQTIASLDHPNIIHIIDVFEENNTAYYVMEYIDGGSLSDMIKRNGAFPEDVALKYIRDIASALGYIHEQRINHLDIKPGNILVRHNNNNAILIDFGLAKHYDSDGEQTTSTPVGISHGYAPIEQYKSGGVNNFSPVTDIYSLGATLYYLVIGKVPPQAATIAESGLPELPSSLSKSVRNVIENSMEIQRKRRPQSIDAFLALLEDNCTATTVADLTIVSVEAKEVNDSTTISIDSKCNKHMDAIIKQSQPNNEIWYTSCHRYPIEPFRKGKDVFGAEIVSNTYKDGKGVIRFDGEVTLIGEYAFKDRNLRRITIPKGVIEIKEAAFYQCERLNSFEGKFASKDGKCLIINDILIAFAPNDYFFELSSYSIPDGVKKIGYGAFYHRDKLQHIIIPNSVTEIGNYAFSGCSGLMGITIPNGVTTIGEYAFAGCRRLHRITIPEGVAALSKGVFRYCENLSEISIPNNVRSIKEEAFSHCESLRNITLPNSLETIGKEAFSFCGLTSITISNSTKEIADRAFAHCMDIEIVYIPNSVTIIGHETFASCSGLNHITIPNSVTIIKSGTFSLCYSLKRVIMSNNVTEIGNSAFSGCSGLRDITIPDSLLKIGYHAFNGCYFLSNEIKGKIKSINPNALNNL